VLVLSIIILPLGPGISGRLLGQIVMIFAFDWFASAGIAGFHVGVEQHWWEGLEACGAGGVDAGANFDDLKAAILAAPLVRCDEVPWSLFGISLAGYNFLASAALGLFAFAVGTKLARTERSPA
jgi:disulfide bond formation protein DsbB